MTAVNFFIQKQEVIYSVCKLKLLKMQQMLYLIQLLKLLQKFIDYISKIKSVIIHKI